MDGESEEEQESAGTGEEEEEDESDLVTVARLPLPSARRPLPVRQGTGRKRGLRMQAVRAPRCLPGVVGAGRKDCEGRKAGGVR